MIRREVYAELKTLVRSMLDGRVAERVLFLTGEAGIGKSTLIEQLMSDMASDLTADNDRAADGDHAAASIIVAKAECSTPVAGSGVGFVEALKPFADIMAQLVERGAAAQQGKKLGGFKLDVGKFLVDTAPSWIGLIPLVGAPIFHALSILGSGYDQVYLHRKLKSEGGSTASSQEQVFRQYVNFLSKLSEQSPLLVIVDDMHWADTSSTNLLFAAARELQSKPIVFLISYRDDDVLRGSSDEDHPIVHIRNEIERYALSRSLQVPRAAIGELSDLVRAQYPQYRHDAAFEQWLLKHTDGNLLFATQYLATLEHEGFIAPLTAQQLKDVNTVTVPPTANAVVSEYIRRLGREDKEQLRYISAEGESVSATMASRLLDLSAIKTIQRLRAFSEQYHILRLVGTQTLYATESTTYQFVHFLVQKTLYDDLVHEERQALHSAAADLLVEELELATSAQHNVHTVAARLAAHAKVSGRYKLAAEAYLKGAEWVWRSFAAAEALRFLDECMAVIEQGKVGALQKPLTELLAIALDAQLLKADIMRHTGRYAAAGECFTLAREQALVLQAHARLSSAYIGIAIVKAYEGLYHDAEADAREALRIANQHHDPENRIHAMRVIGLCLANRSQYEEAAEYDRRCLQVAIDIGNERAQAAALMNLGCLFDNLGEIEVAEEHHQESLQIYRKLHRTDGVISGLLNLSGTMNVKGQSDAAFALLEEALPMAQATGALREEAKILNNMGIIRRQQRSMDAALALLEHSMAIMERIGDKEAVMHALPAIGDVYRDTGRRAEAIGLYKQSAALAEELGNVAAVAKANLFVAFALLLEGRHGEALPLFADCRAQFGVVGAAGREIEAALGVATCRVKSAGGETSTDEMLQLTQEAMGGRKLDAEHYGRIWKEWIVDLTYMNVVLRE